jgi:outer membrane protein TolC
MRAAAALPALAVVLALGACSLTPRYQRPSVPTPPPSYKEAGEWKVAAPADSTPRGPWWTMFHDQELDELEAQVTAANQSLRAALARLEQARAETRIARAAYLPTLTAEASATRQRTSLNGPTVAPGRPTTGNVFIAEGLLAYELDLFGRVRNTVAGARASDYFTLRGLDLQQQLFDRTVADYARALQLTENLYRGGAAAISDLQQAQAQLETARTQAEDTRLRRAQTEHAIAVLTGREASDFTLAPRAGAAELPVPEVAPGLPSELLERRPDVAAAERRVAAANAAIGVARAAYFPVFTLAGAAGQESTRTSNWMSAPSRLWSIGPQGLLTIFDAGAHAAQSAAAHAGYDEQVANYRGTVLAAYQDVEDNLAALRQLQRESVSQAAAVTATQGALEQANLRYKGGIVSYLEVVSTENAALAARLAAVDIGIRRTNATVLLVKALGGDWHNPPR